MPQNGSPYAISPSPELTLIGRCPVFLRCVEKLKKFSHCRAPVLIAGETGTGKEMAARTLHYYGPRQNHPFIPVNCAALPESIFENELFGHRQGAYTDAKKSQPGLVAQAQGGTLFLDEVDSLSLRSQAALLRFLQDRRYRALGDDRDREADVAIISATNANIDNQVERGLFRQDLLFRLNTVAVTLPPLRERQQDIGLIADHFLYQLSELYEREEVVTLDRGSIAWLERQPWRGNVRELQNFLHREFLLSESSSLHIDDSDAHAASPTPGEALVRLSGSCLDREYDDMRKQVLETFNREYLHLVMSETRGNITHASRLMGKDRRSIGRLLKSAGLSRLQYTNSGR